MKPLYLLHGRRRGFRFLFGALQSVLGLQRTVSAFKVFRPVMVRMLYFFFRVLLMLLSLNLWEFKGCARIGVATFCSVVVNIFKLLCVELTISARRGSQLVLAFLMSTVPEFPLIV